MPSGRQANFEHLRGQYPYFEYKSFEVIHDKKGLRFSYVFDLSGQITFRPSVLFRRHPFFEMPEQETLDNLAFHIGMIELISYWKAACSPLMLIRPYSLTESQLQFWKNLYWNGLGEFFHLNGIKTTTEDFVNIEAHFGDPVNRLKATTNEDRVMVPVGGGKDSAVSLELLSSTGHEVLPFVLNPNPAMNRTIQASGIDPNLTMGVDRSLDPILLELNAKGFLNGHTPFSALLAFITSTAALLTYTRHIALSNESSANEATIPGTHINHQYSKSLHFETAFREYLSEFISPEINYFSLLRPLNELQIAWLFSRMPQYHSAFRSCNAGSKTDSWCGQCPKCLFTYTILSPFLSRNELMRIFGKDLFADAGLLPQLESLAGLTPEKPFECVGTINEVQAALDYINKRNHNQNQGLPKLLETSINPLESLDSHLHGFDHHHFLNAHFETLLRNSLND
jgi:hypothetical protein